MLRLSCSRLKGRRSLLYVRCHAFTDVLRRARLHKSRPQLSAARIAEAVQMMRRAERLLEMICQPTKGR